MSDDFDDKPTVVLDYAKIKEQLSQEEKLHENDIVEEDLDIEFSQSTTNNITIDETIDDSKTIDLEDNSKQIICFGYKSDYFTRNNKIFGNLENLNYISGLKELNDLITKDKNSIVILHYNSNPKAVNQVSMQIKKKFQETKSLVIVRNLSTEKAQAHSKSKYGADAYLSEPFSFDELQKTVNSLSEQ